MLVGCYIFVLSIITGGAGCYTWLKKKKKQDSITKPRIQNPNASDNTQTTKRQEKENTRKTTE